jgi:hypothetical protein
LGCSLEVSGARRIKIIALVLVVSIAVIAVLASMRPVPFLARAEPHRRRWAGIALTLIVEKTDDASGTTKHLLRFDTRFPVQELCRNHLPKPGPTLTRTARHTP